MSKWNNVVRLKKAVADAQRWFDDHGGCLAAYIERYGSADDATFYGNGGEAIYKADRDALMRCKKLLQFATGN